MDVYMDRNTNMTGDYYNRNTTGQNRQGTQLHTPSQQPMVPRSNVGSGEDMLMQPARMTPTTMESPYYLAGLLTSYIGSEVRVQFLIGTTGPLIDISGTLVQVGANYIILQPVSTDDLMICDLFSIKFTTIFR
jgi:hypothetical protein